MNLPCLRKLMLLTVAAVAACSVARLLHAEQKPVVRATEIVGTSVAAAEKVLGAPERVADSESGIRSVPVNTRYYKLRGGGTVIAMPLPEEPLTEPFAYGTIEFRFPKDQARSASEAFDLLGLASEEYEGGWTLPELKGWRAEWNRFEPQDPRPEVENSITFLVPAKGKSIDAKKLMGRGRDVAEKSLGTPYRIVGFESAVPGIHCYEVVGVATVLAAPSGVAAFVDGWVEFQFPKSKVTTASQAMRLIGLNPVKTNLVKGKWRFSELKGGWAAEWNGKRPILQRPQDVYSLTFFRQ